jgi:chemotaxis protein methyltransferase CheR
MSLITPAHVERFHALVEERLGLSCADWQAERLPSLLHERMRKGHFSDPDAYLEQLSSPDPSRKELGALAEQLTVGETYFFREHRQVDALFHVAVPHLLKRRQAGAPLRFLSAGCSSGEEAYTLALALRQYSDDVGPINATILGIDMNPAALKKARQGSYSAWSLRATPDRIRNKWFVPSGDGFRLRPEIRSMVAFDQRNLLTEDISFWKPGAFDIVFCRNVTIYFSPDATRAVVARIERSIVPGGFLFLGHSETLRGISDQFELMHTHETFYYRRKDLVRPAGSEPPSFRGFDRARGAGDLSSGFDAESWVSAIQKSAERIEAFTRQLEGLPQPPSERSRSAGEAARRATLQRALELFRAERFEEALSLLTAMRAAPPPDPDVELLTAVIYCNQGLFSEAERICVEATRDEARGATAHYLLGLCREHEGDRRRAMEHHARAVQLDPSFAMPHLHLGLLARRAGDAHTARAEMKLAADLVARERADRILLFGGGFHRNALLELCRAELRASGEAR